MAIVRPVSTCSGAAAGDPDRGRGWPVAQAAEARGQPDDGHKWLPGIGLRAGRAARPQLPAASLARATSSEPSRPSSGRGSSGAGVRIAWRRSRASPLDGQQVLARTGFSRLRDGDRPSGVPVRYVRDHPGRARPPGPQEARTHPARRRSPVPGSADGAPTGPGRQRLRPLRGHRRRRHPARLRRPRPRRERGPAPPGPCSTPRSGSPARRPHRAGPDRQRQGLHRLAPTPRRRDDRGPPQADPAVPAPDQRQGRALHQDAPRRVGLRQALPHQRRALAALPRWVHYYNHGRPHTALTGQSR